MIDFLLILARLPCRKFTSLELPDFSMRQGSVNGSSSLTSTDNQSDYLTRGLQIIRQLQSKDGIACLLPGALQCQSPEIFSETGWCPGWCAERTVSNGWLLNCNDLEGGFLILGLSWFHIGDATLRGPLGSCHSFWTHKHGAGTSFGTWWRSHLFCVSISGSVLCLGGSLGPDLL